MPKSKEGKWVHLKTDTNYFAPPSDCTEDIPAIVLGLPHGLAVNPDRPGFWEKARFKKTQ